MGLNYQYEVHMDIYSRALNSVFFTVVGANLVRVDLFNKPTKVILIDPTVFQPNVVYSAAQVTAAHVTFSTNFFQNQTNLQYSTWASNGWNPSNEAGFQAQLKTWGDANLEYNLGYNLKYARVPFITPALYSFENIGLFAMTYDNNTGTVQYSGSPNLSSVLPNHLFRDGTGNYFKVTSVNNTLKTLTIVDQLTNLIPGAINTTVLDTPDGAVFSTLGGLSIDYAIAFFYPGNQGTLLP